MTTLFTDLDAIRYLYGESSETEKSEIEQAALTDSDFGAELFELKLDLSLLDNLFFSPSDLSLQNIFNFSSAFSTEKER